MTQPPSSRRCPFCGGDLPDAIRVPMDDPIFDEPGHFILVGDERRPVGRGVWLVLLALRKSFPHGVSVLRLLEAIPSHDHIKPRDEKTVAVYIRYLRLALLGTRYDIVTMRGFGYRLALM